MPTETVNRYSVKYQGKEIWRSFALTSDEAKMFARNEVKGHKDTPMEELTAEMIPFDAGNAGSTPAAPARPRKPRVGKGVPRTQKEKTKKRRTIYHLVRGGIQTFDSKEKLDEELDKLTDFRDVNVIEGGTLHTPDRVICEKHWKLT